MKINEKFLELSMLLVMESPVKTLGHFSASSRYQCLPQQRTIFAVGMPINGEWAGA